MFSSTDIERIGWADRGAMGISYNGILASDFDATQEILWIVDKFGMVTSLTPGNQQGALEQAVRWNVYSTFRTFRESHCTALTCGNSNVYISSPDAIRGHRAGGMPCFTLRVPTLTGHNQNAGDAASKEKPTSRGITQLHYLSNPVTGASPKMIFATDNANLQVFDIETVTDESCVSSISTGMSAITAMRVRQSYSFFPHGHHHHQVTGADGELITDEGDNNNNSNDQFCHLLTGSASGEVVLRDVNNNFKAVQTFPVSCNKINAVDIQGNLVMAAAIERRFSSVVKFFDIRKPGENQTIQTLNLNNGIVTWGRFYNPSYSRKKCTKEHNNNNNSSSSPFDESEFVPKCILMQPQEVFICDVNGVDYTVNPAVPGATGTNSGQTTTATSSIGVSPVVSTLPTPGFPGDQSNNNNAESITGTTTSSSTLPDPSTSNNGSAVNPTVSMRLIGTDGATIVGPGNRQLCAAAALNCYGNSLIFTSDRGVMHTLTLDGPVAATGTVSTAPNFSIGNNNNNSAGGAAAGAAAGTHVAFPSPSTEKGLLQCCPVKKYPAQPQTISRWREFNEESGFNPKYDPKTGKPAQELISNWPPEDYVILAVDPPATQLPAHLTEHAGMKLLNADAFGVRRSDAYAANPKDRLGRILPNPYPFGSEIGNDKSLVLANLLELRRVNKNKARANAPKSFYSKMEEALQLCYHTGGHHHTSSQATFDWSHYNMSQAKICGLDNSLPEAFIFNSIIHALYHVQGDDPNGLRRALMSHVCSKKLCVACELGFLFSNMTTQAAHFMSTMPITQPTNFWRALREHEVFKEFLHQKVTGRDEAIARVHNFVKVLLKALDVDLKAAKQNPVSASPGGNQIVMPDLTNFMAATFGTELALQSGQPLDPHFFWELPASASEVIEGLQHLLRVLERMHVGEPVVIQTLPHVLVLLLNPDHGTMRPPPNLNFSRQNENYSYHHCGSVLHLARDHDDIGHSVNHIKFGNQAPHETWYLLNDYAVSKGMPREESLESMIPRQYSHAPIVAFYVRQPANGKQRYGHQTIERPLLFDVCGGVLVDDFGIRQLGRQPPAPDSTDTAPVTALNTERDVEPGDLLAVDAEYVKLVWGNDLLANTLEEEAEVMDEWTKRMLQQQRKPSMNLARVSCILSRDPSDERTVIDDYIETQEAVEDYVTLYSGISEGDLDAKLSKRRLTTAKAVHLKLRCLLDRGVKFVGHGLAQDFRVINLSIPPSQIIDTVEIFGKPGQRKISLRFLAYHTLRERVQESMHDSIEDARTALRLYRRYQELVAENKFEEELDRLFDVGHDSGWRIPGESPPVPKNVLAAIEDSAPAVQDDESRPQTPSALARAAGAGVDGGAGGLKNEDGDVETDDDDDDEGVSPSKKKKVIRTVNRKKKISSASPTPKKKKSENEENNNTEKNDHDENNKGQDNTAVNNNNDDDDEEGEEECYYEEYEEEVEEEVEEDDEENHDDEDHDDDEEHEEHEEDHEEHHDEDEDDEDRVSSTSVENTTNQTGSGLTTNTNNNVSTTTLDSNERSKMLGGATSGRDASTASFPCKSPVNREGTRGPDELDGK